MAREKEYFRENLERLDKAFPNKEILTRREVADYTGINYGQIPKHFPLKSGKIAKVSLAHELS